MKQLTSVYQFLPQQLHSLTLCTKTKFNGKNLKNAYLIDYMSDLLQMFYHQKKSEFNLFSGITKERYGTNYNYYTEYMVKMGYITLVSNYAVNLKSRRYRLSSDITNQKIGRYHNTDTIVLRKHNKFRRDIYNKSTSILPEVKLKMINDTKLVAIDKVGAMNILNGIVGELHAYNSNKYCVEVIDRNEIYCHFDPYGRMHTNFTVLKKSVRTFLHINGEPLCELDINNSQPLFMMKIINESSREGVDEDEFKKYKYLTTTGKLYQYMMNNCEIKEKEIIKKLVYKVLFGKNNERCNSNKIFKSIFPTIHQFIIDYKKTTVSNLAEAEKYKILSHKLQKAESDLIYNTIIKEIMTKYPDVSIISIHDSILFPQRYREVVEEIFTRNINKEFDIYAI